MANRVSFLTEAARFGDWLLRDSGREVKVARVLLGRTQREVGATLGRSASHVSRVEHGLIKGLGLAELARHAAAVGLKPWIGLFPAVATPLDRRQLELLNRFRERIAATWRVELEAVVPKYGDLRAADAILHGAGIRCMVEVITRLADVQAQIRAARRKQRDLGADRLVIVIAGTRTNRRVLTDAGPVIRDAFPLDTRTMLQTLAAGTDPGADGIVLL